MALDITPASLVGGRAAKLDMDEEAYSAKAEHNATYYYVVHPRGRVPL